MFHRWHSKFQKELSDQVLVGYKHWCNPSLKFIGAIRPAVRPYLATALEVDSGSPYIREMPRYVSKDQLLVGWTTTNAVVFTQSKLQPALFRQHRLSRARI